MVRHINVADLHNAGHNARSRRIGRRLDWIPGYKIAVAFFLSLGTNLHLAAAAATAAEEDQAQAQAQQPTMSSPTSAPSSEPEGPDQTIPPLTTYLAQTTEDKISALRLIADSIAQQRQVAARALIFHPATLSAHILLLAAISHLLYSTPNDLPLVLTTAAGVTMAALVSVRWAVQEYLVLAERINFAWLRRACTISDESEGEGKGEVPAVQDEDDEIFVTKFGDEIIGTLVARLLAGDASRKKRAAGPGKGVLRAWTVRLKYRRKGVGGALLVDGVRLVRQRLGQEAGVVWAKDHANSGRILPAMFNRLFERREERARRMLAEILLAETEAPEDEGRPQQKGKEREEKKEKEQLRARKR
ncbi:MAG: hypothetical protein M1816_005462 [Peltula sp. TS41687]|nr:MAG: hypothetical protein M1816_005462 [Peltula sp. TS41687]